MGFIKRHPKLFGLLSFLLIFFPQAVESAWSLFSSEPLVPVLVKKVGGINMPAFGISWITVFSVPIGLAMLIYIIIQVRRRKEHNGILERQQTMIQVVDIYEDNICECGLIFSNTSSTNLVNCHARLLDIRYETPSTELTLNRFSKVEDLICEKEVAGDSKGKIPLFRWGKDKGFVNKSLEIVYRKGTEPIGYGVANVPILVLLNLWADETQNTYAICKLEDRLGWGYRLSILKTGLQKDNPHLATFQTKAPDKGDYQT